MSQIMVSLLFAGVVLEAFNSVVVFFINLIITTLLVVLTLRYRGKNIPKPWLALQGMISNLFKELLHDPWACALLLLTLGEIIWVAFLAYLLPSHDYDALTYHLPSAVAWIQAQKIGISPYSIWSNGYPANAELFFAWLILFLHTDVLVRMGQLIFAIGGMLAVVGLGRSSGLKCTSALAAGCLFFLTPIVLLQAISNYVDVAFASMFLVCFYFLFRYIEHQSKADLLLAGLAGGITLGIKSSGLAYVGISLLVLLVVSLYRRQLNFKQTTRLLLVLGAPLLLLGSYWYLRTWVAYGNPFYPITVRLLGYTLPGVGTFQSLVLGANVPQELVGHSWWQQILLSWWSEPPKPTYSLCIYNQLGNCGSGLNGYYVYDQRLGGFGPQWTYLAMPALVVFIAYSLYRQRGLFFTFLLPFIVIFFVQPANWWSRYTIFIVAPGAIALPYVIDKLNRWWLRGLLQVVGLILVLISLYFSSAQLYFSPQLALHALGMQPEQRTIGNLWYPQFRWVDHVPPGSRIALTGYNDVVWCVYPLFGSQLNNQVFMIQPQNSADFMKTLQSQHIQYLDTTKGSDYAQWAGADPEHFHLIDKYGTNLVYEIGW
jgi:4-amino-4-deoxy-L-arabinose transferase-like glycosyltransferase